MTLPKGVEQWMVDTYHDNVLHQLQQTESVLESTVTHGIINGKKKRFKYLGKVEMTERTQRKGDTNWSEFDMWNRWCYARTFDLAWLDDIDDAEKLLTDPNSDFTLAAVRAGRRRKDRSIIEAFFADSHSGEEEELQINPFPTSQVIDIQTGAAENVGLNLQKLYDAKYYMDHADLPEDAERFMSVTAYQLRELLMTTEVKNQDYNDVKALVKGKVDTFLGFTFKRTQLMPYDSTTQIRRNFAWTKDSMILGTAREVNIKHGPVAEKNFNEGFLVETRLGAARLFDEGVVEIPCKEPPRIIA